MIFNSFITAYYTQSNGNIKNNFFYKIYSLLPKQLLNPFHHILIGRRKFR